MTPVETHEKQGIDRAARGRADSLTRGRSFEQVETFELAGALAAIIVIAVAHCAAQIIFFRVDIDRTGPVLRRLRLFEGPEGITLELVQWVASDRDRG